MLTKQDTKLLKNIFVTKEEFRRELKQELQKTCDQIVEAITDVVNGLKKDTDCTVELIQRQLDNHEIRILDLEKKAPHN